MPNEPTICAASAVACARSEAGPVPLSPKKISSATRPPSAIAMPASISVRVRVNRSSVVAVREQPERPRRLMIESTSSRRPRPEEVRDRRVARLVRRDGLASASV